MRQGAFLKISCEPQLINPNLGVCVCVGGEGEGGQGEGKRGGVILPLPPVGFLLITLKW